VRTDLSAVESTLVLGTDYTVTLNSNQNANPGGNVVLSSALTTSFLLTLTSTVGYLQPTDLTNQGGFYPSVINDSLDRMTILTQQLSEQVNRSVKVNISSSVSPTALINTIIAGAASATTSAANAATSASNAATSDTAAASSATSAANSATAAAAAAASGMYSAVQDKSANYTVVTGDAGDLIRVTTTAGAVTITLPLISGQSDGFKIAVVKWSSDANGVTVARSGSDTINGATSYSIATQYSSATFVADFETDQWFAVSGLSSATTGSGSIVLATSPTITTPVISSIVNTGTLTLPTSTDTLVGRATTDTLTNKTLTNPTVTNYVESVVAIGNSSTSQTLSLTNGTVQTVTMTGNCTFTMPTATAGKSFILIAVQDGTGSRTGTFTSVKWVGGSAPTLTTTATTGRDIFAFVSDGTNWYGTVAQAFA